MKGIIVLSMDFPNPESVAQSLEAIDPERIPHFAGEARIAIGPDAERVTEWLDEEE